MVEGAGRADLALEAALGDFVEGELRVQQLHGDRAAQNQVVGQPDLAHAAAADHPAQRVPVVDQAGPHVVEGVLHDVYLRSFEWSG